MSVKFTRVLPGSTACSSVFFENLIKFFVSSFFFMEKHFGLNFNLDV